MVLGSVAQALAAVEQDARAAKAAARAIADAGGLAVLVAEPLATKEPERPSGNTNSPCHRRYYWRQEKRVES